MVVPLAAAVLLCWGACGLRRLVSAAVFSCLSRRGALLFARGFAASLLPLPRPWAGGAGGALGLSVGGFLVVPFALGFSCSSRLCLLPPGRGFCFPVPVRRRPPPCFARCGLAAGAYGSFVPVSLACVARWVRRRSPAPWPPFVLLPRWLSAGGAFLFSPLCVVRLRRPFALFGAGALARRINGKICNMFCIMAAPLTAAPYKTHILPNAGAGAGGWIRDARKRDAAG